MIVQEALDARRGAVETPRRFAAPLALIALAALALRVVYVLVTVRHLALPSSPADGGVLRSLDELYYVGAARSVAHGHWFDFAFLGPVLEHAEHPPLTSLVLAPVTWFTDGELPLRLLGAVGGALTVVVIGHIGRALGGRRLGLIAAALAAVYPNLWVNDGLLLAETWAALATALLILACYRLWREPTMAAAALVGVCCALAMLARSELVLFVPVLVVPLVLRRAAMPLADRLRVLAVATVVAGLVVSPWVVYNLRRFEEPVVLSYADGGVLLDANCDSTYHGPLLGLANGLCDPIDRPVPDVDFSVAARKQREIAFDYIGDHVGRLPVVMAARFGRVWSIFRPSQMTAIGQAEGRPTWVSDAGLVMYWPLVALGVLGIAWLHRRRRSLLPLLAPFAVVSVNAVVFFGFVRHRIGAEVPLVVLGAAGLCAVLDLAPLGV